jgi:hypothetical protein
VGVGLLSTLIAYLVGPLMAIGVRLADSAFSLLQLTQAAQKAGFGLAVGR